MKTRPASDYKLSWNTRHPKRLRNVLGAILALMVGIAIGSVAYSWYSLVSESSARISKAENDRDEVYAVLNGKVQMIEPLGNMARRSVCEWELLTERE